MFLSSSLRQIQFNTEMDFPPGQASVLQASPDSISTPFPSSSPSHDAPPLAGEGLLQDLLLV